MTMTTQGSKPEQPKAVSPAITSKNLPTPPLAVGQAPPIVNPTPEEAISQAFDEGSIVAKPLTSPDFTGVKLRNPNLIGRWVNRSAMSGLHFGHMEACGFVPTSPSDVIPEQAVMIKAMTKDGRLIYGDLIHMKIPRRDYIGALKFNVESANRRVSRAAQQASFNSELKKATQEASVSVPPALKGKIQSFVPSDSEIARAEVEREAATQARLVDLENQ